MTDASEREIEAFAGIMFRLRFNGVRRRPPRSLLDETFDRLWDSLKPRVRHLFAEQVKRRV